MIVVLLGAPGAGKGTQAEIMINNLNIVQISTGDILRNEVRNETALGLDAKTYMDKGGLVPDSVILGMISSRIEEDDCANGFILDGFPRTIVQAQELATILEKKDLKLDKVINIDVNKELLIQRLTSRVFCSVCKKGYNLLFSPPTLPNVCDKCGGQLMVRDDDNEETVKSRLDVYELNTKPLIDYYNKEDLLFSVNGNDKPEKIFEIIKSELTN